MFDNVNVVVYDNARMIHSHYKKKCPVCGEQVLLEPFKAPRKKLGRIVPQKKKDIRRANKIANKDITCRATKVWPSEPEPINIVLT